MESTAPKSTSPFSGMKKFLRTVVIILVLVLAGYIYWKFYYPFTSDGVKSGYLNYAVKKGQIFKTYEGKLIQSGFRSRTPGTIQSYEFEFSVADKRIAEALMVSSGKEVELHYKEYLRPLAWRGYNKYVVDSIIAIHDIPR